MMIFYAKSKFFRFGESVTTYRLLRHVRHGFVG